MSTPTLAGLLLVTALALGLALHWRLTGLAARRQRAERRVKRTWAALDAALVRRARRVTTLIGQDALDPAAALLLADAAAAALEPGLDPRERERAESDLSHVLLLVGELAPATREAVREESAHAGLRRHLHNDAVTTAQALRRHRGVRMLRLSGHAVEHRPFEMVDDRQLGWPRDG